MNFKIPYAFVEGLARLTSLVSKGEQKQAMARPSFNDPAPVICLSECFAEPPEQQAQ